MQKVLCFDKLHLNKVSNIVSYNIVYNTKKINERGSVHFEF